MRSFSYYSMHIRDEKLKTSTSFVVSIIEEKASFHFSTGKLFLRRELRVLTNFLSLSLILSSSTLSIPIQPASSVFEMNIEEKKPGTLFFLAKVEALHHIPINRFALIISLLEEERV